MLTLYIPEARMMRIKWKPPRMKNVEWRKTKVLLDSPFLHWG